MSAPAAQIFSFTTPSLLAAGAPPAFLTDAVALIVAGAAIAYLSFRLKLVPIVGFLLAGVLIGPNAFGLVNDRELVDATAEIGVILLLFTIGIEFSLEKLASIQKLIFGGGTAQVGLSIGATTAVLLALGVDWKIGVFTGMLVALSSTAIVLKLLADNGETGSEPGQVGLGLLIFQDLAIVVMVLIVPTLGVSGGGGVAGVAWALVKAVGIIAAVLLIARRIMPRVLESVARTCSPELFLLTVIAICLGTAYLTSLAGVSLSLGAFLAGLMVSESRFSQHALSETLPLQILFSATFFVSVGMLLDLGFLFRNLPLVMGAIAAVLIIKIATTWTSVRVIGYTTPVAAASALMLAQIGEFSFVLERAGREAGLTPAGFGESGSQTFIAATVVLMVLTPFLMRTGSGLAGKMTLRAEAGDLGQTPNELAPLEGTDLEDHVIVAGYGQAARSLVRVLSGSGIPFVITTLSPDGANEAEALGLPVVRGDATKPFLLQHVGVGSAKMMVIADDNPATAHRIVSVARQLSPTMRIVVRTRHTEEVEALTVAGADSVIAEELESIVQLFGEVLRDYRIPAAEIQGYEELARRHGYSAFLDADADPAPFKCQPGEDCFDSRTVTIREGSPAVGRTLGSLRAAENLGLEIRSLRRSGLETVDPGSSLVLQPGDELVIAGPTQAFVRSAALFRISSRTDAELSSTSAPTPAADAADAEFRKQTGIDLETRITYAATVDGNVCSHLDRIKPVFPTTPGCEECLRIGAKWVHLRLCLSCGHVGCCDTSEHKHATKHFHATEHPIIKSIERGDDWAWCFRDEEYI